MTTQTKKPKWEAVSFDHIERRREELGLAKLAMARALGVTNSTYHNWKRGITVPHQTQQEEIRVLLASLTPEAAASQRASRGTRPGPQPYQQPSGLPERTFGLGENVAGGPMLDRALQPYPFFSSIVQSVPGKSADIATIVAAFISSQKEPPSAGSVIELVEGLKKALP